MIMLVSYTIMVRAVTVLLYILYILFYYDRAPQFTLGHGKISRNKHKKLSRSPGQSLTILAQNDPQRIVVVESKLIDYVIVHTYTNLLYISHAIMLCLFDLCPLCLEIILSLVSNHILCVLIFPVAFKVSRQKLV